jgi:hypothetical protein
MNHSIQGSRMDALSFSRALPCGRRQRGGRWAGVADRGLVIKDVVLSQFWTNQRARFAVQVALVCDSENAQRQIAARTGLAQQAGFLAPRSTTTSLATIINRNPRPRHDFRPFLSSPPNTTTKPIPTTTATYFQLGSSSSIETHSSSY